MAQLRRIQTATLGNNIEETVRNEFVAQSAENAAQNIFITHDLEKYGSISVGTSADKSEIVISCDVQGMPLSEMIDIINSVKQTVNNYEKSEGNRNRKADRGKLNKHAMHLVRLLHVLKEILEEGDVHTKRTDDLQELLDIRFGKYMDERGVFKQEFFDYIDRMEKECDRLCKKSTLREKPDHKGIDKLLEEINLKTIERSEYDLLHGRSSSRT